MRRLTHLHSPTPCMLLLLLLAAGAKKMDAAGAALCCASAHTIRSVAPNETPEQKHQSRGSMIDSCTAE
jgi:hypothetical protein